MTSILNAMIYSLSSLYSSVNLIICSHATSESATMMSSKSISSMSKLISESASMTLSKQWSTHLHRSIYQWIDSSIQSCANNESVTKTSFVNAMIYLLTSFYSSVNLIKHSCATSESATMNISILDKTKKIHSCKHESLKRRSNVTILAMHLCW